MRASHRKAIKIVFIFSHKRNRRNRSLENDCNKSKFRVLYLEAGSACRYGNRFLNKWSERRRREFVICELERFHCLDTQVLAWFTFSSDKRIHDYERPWTIYPLRFWSFCWWWSLPSALPSVNSTVQLIKVSRLSFKVEDEFDWKSTKTNHAIPSFIHHLLGSDPSWVRRYIHIKRSQFKAVTEHNKRRLVMYWAFNLIKSKTSKISRLFAFMNDHHSSMFWPIGV